MHLPANASRGIRRRGRHRSPRSKRKRVVMGVVIGPFALVLLFGAITSIPSSPANTEPPPPTLPTPQPSVTSRPAPEPVELPPGGTFFDDDNSVHEPQIEAIAAEGITTGCSSEHHDLYCPTTGVTRGQMAAFLVRAMKLPRTSPSPFTDTDGIFERDIAALAEEGITTGCGPETFCPEDEVTRGEMAAFLVRALDLPPSEEDPFVDARGVFRDDIAALAAAGITTGCGSDTYCPRDSVTREEMASFLSRAFQLPPNDPPERPTLRAAFTGDTLIHSQLYRRAAAHGDDSERDYDFRPMFDDVADLISEADLALCHLEVPLSPSSTDLSGYPLFNAPGELASDLADVGYEGCSVASNHSIDQGVDGLVDTIDLMEEAGLGHTGTYRTEEEADTITTYEVSGATVAHLSSTYGLNGLVLPDGEEWRVDMLDVDEIFSRAEQAREDGADLVVASVHCCVEYQTIPPDVQREPFQELLESDDIDLVVGHHAHVVQPIDKIGNEYLIYGLGNFLSAQRTSPRADGVIVNVDFAQRGDRWVARGVEYIPTMVENNSWDIEVATGSSRSRTIDAIETYDPNGVKLGP
ncbi:MAG: hypothetical protein GEU79_17350 [Acidimicrobiia bacterium]|nr:hypothetical protein [Acidimicrobiia bacterium]